MQNDALLVRQTLVGDKQAFHQLIVRYQSDIYTFIMSYVKNTDDAKELVQEVFFKAYSNLASLKKHEQFYYWLRQIAKNCCQNWLGRKKDFVPLNDDMVAKTQPIDEMLIFRESLTKVMQAIEELPEIEKKILKERYLDDSSYDELRERYKLSYKALSMRLLRAKQKVREKIERLLAGVSIFSWRDALKKMSLEGVEAVKISVKSTIVSISVVSVLFLSGAGVIIWYHQGSKDISQGSIDADQATFMENSQNLNNKSSNKMYIQNTPSEKLMNEKIDGTILGLNLPNKNFDSDANITKLGLELNDNIIEEVNKPKKVRDFSEFDLSTPESAWATIMRLITQGSYGDWTLVCMTKDIEEVRQLGSGILNDMSEEQIDNYLNAEIIEVYVSGDIAGVVSEIPNQGIDLRYLIREGKEWKNFGNDSVRTIGEARQKYENGLNILIP